jgi:hypothetical protein
VLALHAWLLPQGMWADEYFTFGIFRLYGLPAFWNRLLHWSPRPFSEALVWAYWRAVHATGRPLVAPVLLIAWLFALAFASAAIRPWRRPGRAARLALLLGLPALALLSAPVEELYYWPLGALAYLPALGAAAYVAILAAGPGLRTDRQRLAVAAALTAGAASVEMGLFLALASAPLLLLADRRQAGEWRRFAVATALLPTAIAAFLLALLLFGRVSDTSEILPSALTHHFWPSMREAAERLFWELLVPDPDHASAGSVASSLITKLLFFAGAAAALPGAWPIVPPRWPLAAIAAALAATLFLSIAASYYQFGAICCERHAAYRQVLIILMLVTAAGLLPRWRQAADAGWPIAPALLALALLPALPARLVALGTQFALGPSRAAARATTFSTGEAPGAAPLHYVIPAPGPLLSASPIPPGDYALAAKPAWYIQGPMLFFGKDRMRVSQ